MKNILIISGLDPSGGAGFLADARVVFEHGYRAVGVVTALTEQTTSGVSGVTTSSMEVVAAQLRALLTDIEVAAVKIGMLGSAAMAHAVGEALALTWAPVVWDPVLLPSRGRLPLFVGNPAVAVAALRDHVTLLTPNISEAVALGERDEPHAAAQRLRDIGFEAVLLKGGHRLGEEEVVDVLLRAGEPDFELRGPRIAGATEIHGTGCALATAIACRLADSVPLPAACEAGRSFVAERLQRPQTPGRGAAALL